MGAGMHLDLTPFNIFFCILTSQMLFVNISVKSFFKGYSLHAGGKIFPPVYCLLFCQLLAQADANLNALNKSRLFVVPAESTDGVDDLVDLLQRFPVHELVALLKVGFDGCVIHAGGVRQLLSRGKITFYSLIFMEWAMNCKVCVLWALW